MKATLAERGQVTIPKAIRDRLGLTAGSVLDFELEGGRLVARKVVDDPVEELRGCLAQQSTDAFLKSLRGE